jgi:hypothetical protein
MSDMIDALAAMPGMKVVHPNSVLSMTGLRYSDKQTQGLLESLPNRELAERIALEKCVLVPTLPEPYNLHGLLDIFPEMFSEEARHICKNPYEMFAGAEHLRAAVWIALRAVPFTASKLSTWSEQENVAPLGMYIPRAVESAYVKIIRRMLNHTSSNPPFFCRTSSESGFGNVAVGPFKDGCLQLSVEKRMEKRQLLLLDLAMMLE